MGEMLRSAGAAWTSPRIASSLPVPPAPQVQCRHSERPVVTPCRRLQVPPARAGRSGPMQTHYLHAGRLSPRALVRPRIGGYFAFNRCTSARCPHWITGSPVPPIGARPSVKRRSQSDAVHAWHGGEPSASLTSGVESKPQRESRPAPRRPESPAICNSAIVGVAARFGGVLWAPRHRSRAPQAVTATDRHDEP